MINIKKKPYVCPACLLRSIHNEKYDAYYCLKCNMWLEDKCDDRKCFFCTDRPEHPIDENGNLNGIPRDYL